MIRVVEKHLPREYSLIVHDNGIVVCDKQEGALFVMRYAEDVERLKAILATVDVVRLPPSEGEK